MPGELGGYRPVELLGRGGMGEVWRAEREGPGGIKRRAALKRILPRMRNDPVLRERFLAEARTNARLEHPNIVQVLDFGDQPEPYLILEYVEGIPVADLLSELAVSRMFLPAVAAAFIVAEAAAGLDYAHRRKDEKGQPLGIIHRDVSPQNILISVEGAVKVTDFGIVRAADNKHRTMDGMSVGKLGYMSPEQVAGEPFDARADVFALGVMLWELLTLQPLLPRQDANAALQILLKGEFRKPSQMNPALPPSIDALVMPAIARQPDRRVPSAGALAQSLRSFIHSVSPGFDSGELMRILSRLLPNLAVHAANPVEVPVARELTNPGASPWGAAQAPHAPQAMVAIPPAAVAHGRLPSDLDEATAVRKPGAPPSYADEDGPTQMTGAKPAAAQFAANKATLVGQEPLRPPQGPTVALNASITAGGIPHQRPSPAPPPANNTYPPQPNPPARVSLSRSGVNIPATTALAAFPTPAAPAPGAMPPQYQQHAPPMYSSTPGMPPARPSAAGYPTGLPYGAASGDPRATGYQGQPPRGNNSIVLPLVALGAAIVLGAGAVVTVALVRHRAAPPPPPSTTPFVPPALPSLPSSTAWNGGTQPGFPPPGSLGPVPTIPTPPGSAPPSTVFPTAPGTMAPGGAGAADAGAATPPQAPQGAVTNTGAGTRASTSDTPGGSATARHSGSSASPAEVIRRQMASARAQVANCVGGGSGVQVDADVTYDGDRGAVAHVAAQITGSTGRPFASLCVKHALQSAVNAPGVQGLVTAHYTYVF